MRVEPAVVRRGHVVGPSDVRCCRCRVHGETMTLRVGSANAIIGLRLILRMLPGMELRQLRYFVRWLRRPTSAARRRRSF